MVIGQFCEIIPDYADRSRVKIATDNILAGNNLYQLAEKHPDEMKMEEVKLDELSDAFYDSFDFACVRQIVLFSIPTEWANRLANTCREIIERQVGADVGGKHHIDFGPYSPGFVWENYGYSGTWGI